MDDFTDLEARIADELYIQLDDSERSCGWESEPPGVRDKWLIAARVVIAIIRENDRPD